MSGLNKYLLQRKRIFDTIATLNERVFYNVGYSENGTLAYLLMSTQRAIY